MEEPIINIFQKGAISDIDKIHDPGESEGYWSFPTENISIVTKDGQGFIITSKKGNTIVDVNDNPIGHGEEFSLSHGFIPIGACVFNGISYIASFHPILNQCEIGSFPSVDFASGATLFQRQYKPLYNYKQTPGSAISHLRTSLFNFQKECKVSMFAQRSYDDSVNLFLADGFNKNRIINTGFKQNGELTGKYYIPEDFNGRINQYPSTNSSLKTYLEKIVSPGSLLCGNYVFYFRLMTADFDTTNVIAESGPYQVYSGGSFDSVNNEGTIATVCGGNRNTDSGKSIHIRIENIDTSYKYIAIYYTRYYSDENDALVHENRIINFNYEITGSTMYLKILGNETSSLLSDDLLLQKYPDFNICKTHCQSENIYYGANWKTTLKHDESMITFARLVTLSYGVEKIFSPGLNESDTGGQKIYDKHPKFNQYKDYYLTYDKVGHFRTESYPYGLVYEMIDGTMSDVYPCVGIDALCLTPYEIDDFYSKYYHDMLNPLDPPTYFKPYHPGTSSGIPIVNEKGIIRMPGYNLSWTELINGVNELFQTQLMQWWNPDPLATQDPYINLLYVKIDFEKAMTWVETTMDVPWNGGDKSWISNNVRAIHVVRGDRNQNFKFQGFSMVCSRAIGNTQMAQYTIGYSHYDDPYTHQPYADLGSNNGGVGWGVPSIDSKRSNGSTWVSGGSVFRDEYNLCLDSGMYQVEPNCQWDYKRDCVMPIYKGYAPTHWWKKNTLNNHRVCNVNRVSRFWYEAGKYAIYSFTHLFRQTNNLDNIGACIKNIYYDTYGGKSLTDYRDSNTGNNDEIKIFPTTYMVDQFTTTTQIPESVQSNRYYYDSTLNEFIANSHFDGQFIKDNLHMVGESYPETPATTVGKTKRFINRADEYYQSEQDTMYFIADVTGSDRKQWWYNRSMYTQKYLGFITIQDYDHPMGSILGSGHYDGRYNYNHSILTFYKKDPYLIFDITELYNPEEIFYKIVSSNPIMMNEISVLNSVIETERKIWRGDCFIQRAYFKQMYWNGSQFGSDQYHEYYDTVGFDTDVADNPDPGTCSRVLSSFSHGLIIGVISECELNVAMRHSGKTTTHFPNMTDSRKFAITPFNTNGIESLLLNKGYSVTTSQRQFPHYFKKAPELVMSAPTRIYHSVPRIESSFVTGYRSVLEMNYVDYDSQYGPIEFICDTGFSLMSVQHSRINQHYSGEREQKVPTTEGELSIGSGPILSKQVRALANFGTQHSGSIIKTDIAVYGVDVSRRIIWGTGTETTTSGSVVLAVKNLSLEKLIQKEVNDIVDSISDYSDNVYSFKDTPCNGEGISTGYDPKFKEVYFTFIKFIDRRDVSKTLRFSEIIQGFLDNPSIKSPFYFSINDDFYSSGWGVGDHTPNQYMYRDGVGPDLLFYGQTEEFKLSIVSKGAKGAQLGHKVFLSQKIHSPHVEFDKVEWSTENGSATSDPFINSNEPWRNPEYASNYWHVPINVKVDAPGDDYQQNSDTRGTWLKTTLTYAKKISIFVKNIETFFIKSFS